jgi:hypothetical protein
MTNRPLLYVNNSFSKKTIPNIPWMDDKGLEVFIDFSKKSKCYLEFGCGGSTVYIAKNTTVQNILSVDSDEKWVSDITKEIITSDKKIYLEYCNIGDVGNWGVPRNMSHINNYWSYMTIPWEIAKINKLNPDLILVDGRFRVACFLYSLLCAEPNSIILFDDYKERPEYFIVEKFCKLDFFSGRMAVFKVEKEFSLSELVKTIAKYSIITD